MEEEVLGLQEQHHNVPAAEHERHQGKRNKPDALDGEIYGRTLSVH